LSDRLAAVVCHPRDRGEDLTQAALAMAFSRPGPGAAREISPAGPTARPPRSSRSREEAGVLHTALPAWDLLIRRKPGVPTSLWDLCPPSAVRAAEPGRPRRADDPQRDSRGGGLRRCRARLRLRAAGRFAGVECHLRLVRLRYHGAGAESVGSGRPPEIRFPRTAIGRGTGAGGAKTAGGRDGANGRRHVSLSFSRRPRTRSELRHPRDRSAAYGGVSTWTMRIQTRLDPVRGVVAVGDDPGAGA
jgi:hypothetical protein